MGSFKGQKSPGRYIDGTYYQNLDVLARKIADDMTFLIVFFSSTLEVGTGKSTFAQHTAEAITEMVNKHHGHTMDKPLELTARNIVFRPKDLIKRSFELPKYSTIILDEWEDAHYWSELGMTLREFFRKCRQLNLFIIIIIPNYFQLTPSYALNRSVFAVDVKFAGDFERGFFDFYNFRGKKELYLKGKRTQNYGVQRPNFSGRFVMGYSVGEKQYRDAKYRDMKRSEEEGAKPKISPRVISMELCRKMRKNMPHMTQQELAQAFSVSDRTIRTWLSEDKGVNKGAG